MITSSPVTDLLQSFVNKDSGFEIFWKEVLGWKPEELTEAEKGKHSFLETIPSTFTSSEQYFNSFKLPILNESKAMLSQAFTSSTQSSTPLVLVSMSTGSQNKMFYKTVGDLSKFKFLATQKRLNKEQFEKLRAGNVFILRYSNASLGENVQMLAVFGDCDSAVEEGTTGTAGMSITLMTTQNSKISKPSHPDGKFELIILDSLLQFQRMFEACCNGYKSPFMDRLLQPFCKSIQTSSSSTSTGDGNVGNKNIQECKVGEAAAAVPKKPLEAAEVCKECKGKGCIESREKEAFEEENSSMHVEIAPGMMLLVNQPKGESSKHRQQQQRQSKFEEIECSSCGGCGFDMTLSPELILAPGVLVELNKLEKAAHLNGKFAKVSCFDVVTERYECEYILEDGVTTAPGKFKISNLKLLPFTPITQTGISSSVNKSKLKSTEDVNRGIYGDLIERSAYFATKELNQSQDDALCQFTSNDEPEITLVQGPPGTGKTSFSVATILQLMENIQTSRLAKPMRMCERVLVCAPANKAVCHLLERYAAKLISNDNGPCLLSSLSSSLNDEHTSSSSIIMQDVLISYPLNKTVLVGVGDKIRSASEYEENSVCSDLFCWNELETLSNRIRMLSGSCVDAGISQIDGELDSFIQGISKLHQCADDSRQWSDRGGGGGGLQTKFDNAHQLKLLLRGLESLKSNFSGNLVGMKAGVTDVSLSPMDFVIKSLENIGEASKSRLGKFYINKLETYFQNALNTLALLKEHSTSSYRASSRSNYLSWLNAIESLANTVYSFSKDTKLSKLAAQAAVTNADILFSTIGSAGNSIVQKGAFSYESKIVMPPSEEKETNNHLGLHIDSSWFDCSEEHDDDEYNYGFESPADDCDSDGPYGYTGNNDNSYGQGIDSSENIKNTKKKRHPRFIDSIGFTTVIVDEAGQALEAEMLIPLSLGCKKLLLVGDPKQLPATIISQTAKQAQFARSLLERLMGKKFSENEMSQVGKPVFSSSSYSSSSSSSYSSSSSSSSSSLLSHTSQQHLEINKSPCFLLDTQYRMAQSIVQFPNRFFYGGKLITPPNITGLCSTWNLGGGRKRPCDLRDKYFGGSLVWAHVGDELVNYDERFSSSCKSERGRHSLNNSSTPASSSLLLRNYETNSLSSISNEKEARFIVDMVRWFVDDSQNRQTAVISPNGIVIIAMYSAQVSLIRSLLLKDRSYAVRNVAVHTVDSFQGSEAPVVLLSMVRSNVNGNIGFLGDGRRLNVAITRAKDLLIVVGDGNTFDSKARTQTSSSSSNAAMSLYADIHSRGRVKYEEHIRQDLGISQRQPPHSYRSAVSSNHQQHHHRHHSPIHRSPPVPPRYPPHPPPPPPQPYPYDRSSTPPLVFTFHRSK